MKNLNNIEIKVVNGGDLNCPKTLTSVISSICVTTGITIQTWATTYHLNLNMTDPTIPKVQRSIAICINIAGLCLNIAGAALSMISAAEANCANVTTSTNSTTSP